LVVFGRDRITVRGDKTLGTGPGTSFNQQYWFRLIDMSSGKGVIWMHQITDNFEYSLDKSFFHIFPGKTRMFGFCFDEDAEADKFHKKIVARLPAAGMSLLLAHSLHFSDPIAHTEPAAKRMKKPLPPLPPRRISPSMISAPAAGTFVHVSHVGYDENGVIEMSDNIEPGWTMMLHELEGHGVPEQVVKNDAQFVDGFWAGVNAVHAGNAQHEEQERVGEKRRRVHRKPVERI